MTKTKITPEEALAYHLEPRPGKYDIVASTPMATQRGIDHLRDEHGEQRGLAPVHPRPPHRG